MGFRFWRRIRLAPGLTLNLSKSGGSLSFGPRSAKFTVGSRDKRATVGLPGTGLFYTSTLASGKRPKSKARKSRDYAPTVRPEDLSACNAQAGRLTMGLMQALPGLHPSGGLRPSKSAVLRICLQTAHCS